MVFTPTPLAVAIITIQLSIKTTYSYQFNCFFLSDSAAILKRNENNKKHLPDQYKWYGFDDVLYKRSESPHLAKYIQERADRRRGAGDMEKREKSTKQEELYLLRGPTSRGWKQNRSGSNKDKKAKNRQTPIKNEKCQDYFLQSERFFST